MIALQVKLIKPEMTYDGDQMFGILFGDRVERHKFSNEFFKLV